MRRRSADQGISDRLPFWSCSLGAPYWLGSEKSLPAWRHYVSVSVTMVPPPDGKLCWHRELVKPPRQAAVWHWCKKHLQWRGPRDKPRMTSRKLGPQACPKSAALQMHCMTLHIVCMVVLGWPVQRGHYHQRQQQWWCWESMRTWLIDATSVQQLLSSSPTLSGIHSDTPFFFFWRPLEYQESAQKHGQPT